MQDNYNCKRPHEMLTEAGTDMTMQGVADSMANTATRTVAKAQPYRGT